MIFTDLFGHAGATATVHFFQNSSHLMRRYSISADYKLQFGKYVPGNPDLCLVKQMARLKGEIGKPDKITG